MLAVGAAAALAKMRLLSKLDELLDPFELTTAREAVARWWLVQWEQLVSRFFFAAAAGQGAVQLGPEVEQGALASDSDGEFLCWRCHSGSVWKSQLS